MSPKRLEQWHHNIAQLIHCQHEQSIDILLKALETLVNGSNSLFIVYTPNSLATIPAANLQNNQDTELHIRKYIESAYLLDPFYRHAIDNQFEGMVLLSDVAPKGFKQSEFYQRYYRLINSIDEACYFVQLENKGILNLSITRQTEQKQFSQKDRENLQSVYPLVKAVLLNWQQHTKQKKQQPDLQTQIDHAFNFFGRSVLTPRECQLLQLLLKGHAINSAAERLGISPETAKQHKKNIYLKLDINSQGQLFHLFLDSLRHYKQKSQGDPLKSYLGLSDN